MSKQFPTAAFAKASITPAFTSTRTFYTEAEIAREKELDNAEISELGSLSSVNGNPWFPSQINRGQEAETLAWWRSLAPRSRPTPGGLWREDYSLASNSWVD